MRALPLLILFLSHVASAYNTSLSIGDYTPCGYRCLISSIPKSGCAITDLACQCHSKSLVHHSAACLNAQCTMQDTLVTSRVTASVCKLPSVSRSGQVKAYIISLTSVAFVIVAGRLWGNIYRKQLGWDDAIIATSMALSIIPAACLVKMASLGFGKHLYDLEDGHLSRILILFYIAEITYVVVLGLAKLSLVIFYLRVFPAQVFKYFAWASWAVFAFVLSSTVIIFFLTIFACNPVAFFWNTDLHGKCLDLKALAYANSGLAIAQDFIILSLPLAMITKLPSQMSRIKRIGVAFMFVIGSFGAVTSVIRLRSLLKFGETMDPSWEYVSTVLWTTIELAAGLICASVPSIRKSLDSLLTGSFRSRITSRGASDATSSYASKRKRPWQNESLEQTQSCQSLDLQGVHAN